MDGRSEKNLCWPQAQTDLLELCRGLPCGATHLSHLARSCREIQWHPSPCTLGMRG